MATYLAEDCPKARLWRVAMVLAMKFWMGKLVGPNQRVTKWWMTTMYLVSNLILGGALSYYVVLYSLIRCVYLHPRIGISSF